LDGLRPEFFKKFWSTLSPFFHKVLTSIIHKGVLPVSMRRAVIVLLPKAGDRLNITKWRPISLLNVDYELFDTVITNRLTRLLPEIISDQQSYAVPERSIFHNLHLLRDCIALVNTHNLPLAIASLDQKKIFDFVNHSYIHQVLSSYGFGPVFKYTLYCGRRRVFEIYKFAS